MKTIKYAIWCILSFIMAFAILGCTTDKKEKEKHHFDNKIFINTQNFAKDILFKPSTGDVSRTLSVSTAMRVEDKVTGTFRVGLEYVDIYNKTLALANETAVALPVEMCELENASVEIAKGSNLSTDATITFKNLSTLNRDVVYVLPIILENVKGIDILNSKSVVYYVFKGASLINVVADIARTYFHVRFGSEGDRITAITVECLINVRDFSNCGGEKGEAMSTIFGIEGDFLVRIGDAGFPENQVQLVNPGGNFPPGDSELGLPTNEWVHIAAVYDTKTQERIIYYNGKQVAYDSGNAVRPVNLDTGDCYIGKAWNNQRWLNGFISELRVWRVHRTQEEIANNFYEVDPNSEGLIRYWKFNDGAGNTIKDYSKYAGDVTAAGNITWKKVSLPEKNR